MVALGRIGATHVLANDGISPLRVVRAIGTHSGAELVSDALDEDGKTSVRGRAIDVSAQDGAVAHRHGHAALDLDLELAGAEHPGWD